MKNIFKVFIPTLISYLTFVLVNIIDGIFIGNLFGQKGQVAMGLVVPVNLIITAIVFSLVVGGNTYMGHAIGEKDEKEANKIFNHMIFYGSLIILIIIAIILLTLVPFIISKITDDTTKLYFLQYASIFIPSIVLLYVCIFLNFTQRVIGNPSVTTKSSLIALISNIIFNTTFSIIFNFGIIGIALSSTMSIILQIIYLLIVYKKTNKEFFKIKYYKLEIRLMFKIFINGLSDGIFDLSNAIVQFLNITLLVGFIGEVGSSYLYVLNSILMIWLMVFFSLSDSLNPLISVEFGKKNYQKIKYYRNTVLKMCVVLGILGYVILMLIRGDLLTMFGVNDMVDRIYLLKYSRYYFLVVLVFGINQTIVSYLTSLGQSKASLFLGVMRNIILIILVTLFLTAILGEVGIWLSYFTTEAISIVLGIVILLKKKPLKML